MAVVKTGKSVKLETIEMELALAEHFDKRHNLIVPNISWGMMSFGADFPQCDLLIITRNDYAYQIEIKVSKSDLIADTKKRHNHLNGKIRKLYFAIPDYLKNCEQYIPKHAGIIIVDSRFVYTHQGIEYYNCQIVREAEAKSEYKFTDKEKFNVARLGCLRSWRWKGNLLKLMKKKGKI
ncbi:MAG: hypothetical protein WC976_06740 [Caldisericia bacterium]